MQARSVVSRLSHVGGNFFSDAVLGRVITTIAKLKLVSLVPSALSCAEKELPPDAYEAIGSLLTDLSSEEAERL